MEHLLTTEQLADHLQLRPGTIRRWARSGRIPRVKLSGKVIRYNLSDVERALLKEVRRGNGFTNILSRTRRLADGD